MCGRYTLYTHEDELAALFAVTPLPLEERYNIAPTEPVPVIYAGEHGRRAAFMRWGLVPHWAKTPDSIRSTLFNARSETAAEKPSFRDAMRRSRCIMPASGFYEWRTEGSTKQPYFIHRKDGKPIAFAGLHSTWTKGETPLHSCTILTTAAEGSIRELHHRVPVILEEDDWERWLDPKQRNPHAVEDLLHAPPEETLTWHAVGRQVGNARNDTPELIKPLPT